MKALKILMNGPGVGTVWLDGEEVKDVVNIEFRAAVRTVNQVTLTLNVGAVEIDTPADSLREDRC